MPKWSTRARRVYDYGKQQRADEDKFDVTQLDDNAWKKRDKVCVLCRSGGKSGGGNRGKGGPWRYTRKWPAGGGSDHGAQQHRDPTANTPG
jgi:hypothetical protein